MAGTSDHHHAPAGDTGIAVAAPAPVAPSPSDFDAHHYHRYERTPPTTSSSGNTDTTNTTNTNNDYWREAFELDEVRSPRPSSISTASISSGECRSARSFRVITQASTIRSDDGPFRVLRKFWLRNVVLTVPQCKNRDHFALERTYLAYIRTSLAFAFLGVMIAQLFRLQSRGSDSGPSLGFDDLGIPLACSCYASAILIALLGAHRFWRQQNAMARGKVYAGGWELNTIGIIGAAVSVVILSLVITVSAR